MTKRHKHALSSPKRRKKAIPEDLAVLLPPAPPYAFTPEETAEIVRHCDSILAAKKEQTP